MKADMSRTSPMIVDIWFLKVSLPCSHRPRSPVNLFSNATLLSTYSIQPKSPIITRRFIHRARLYDNSAAYSHLQTIGPFLVAYQDLAGCGC